MKRTLFIILLIVGTLAANAAIKFTAKAPASVQAGEQFRVQYQINSANVSGMPQVGSFGGLTVLYGPAVSTSSSVQIINGNYSQNSSTTYTYTLEASKEGTYTLPAATVRVDGHTYTSNSLKVTVTKGAARSSSAASANQPSGAPQQVPATKGANPKAFNPSDLYIEVSANKREVYEQEPVVLSYNVYTNLMLEQMQGKMPDLKGFVSKEVPMPREKQLTVTRHNGRTCQTVTWSKYVMFPQQSGKLTVPSIDFEGVVAYPNPNVDPVDAFFFGSTALTKVNHTIKAPTLDITVKPLPAKPADFSGAVGRNFAVSAAVVTKNPRENEMLTLRVKVSGVGNIELITPPAVKFPADFETYDPKPSAKTEITTEGMSGELIIDYLAIPNHQGSFTIPPVELVYFSPADGQYHTISSGAPITIQVAKGNPNSYAARQLLKDNDIHPIDTDEISSADGVNFWLSLEFWLAIAGLAVLFVVVNIVLGTMAARNSDQRGTALRKANAKAVARLNNAEKLMAEGKTAEFYGETLSALRHFVADKTGVGVAELSTDKIADLFAQYGIEEQDTQRLQSIISNCEAHIYGASSSDAAEMQAVYREALSIIAQLNPLFKRKKK